MKKTLFLLPFIFFCSCSDPEFVIDVELHEYYNNFILEAGKRNIIIDDSNLVLLVQDGVLREYGGNAATIINRRQTTILIDHDRFVNRGELIEMTVFHELGHAKLNRNHNNTLSLMNPAISGGLNWNDCSQGESCKKYLIDELFNPK